MLEKVGLWSSGGYGYCVNGYVLSVSEQNVVVNLSLY
jgi:hypothetical protein